MKNSGGGTKGRRGLGGQLGPQIGRGPDSIFKAKKEQKQVILEEAMNPTTMRIASESICQQKGETAVLRSHDELVQ